MRDREMILVSQSLIEEYAETIKSQKAEIEMLKNAYEQCAWERDIFAEDMKEEIKKDCSYLMLDIKTIKAEAIKEFAERLKEKFSEYYGMKDFNLFSAEFVLDNLVKEMVGDAE